MLYTKRGFSNGNHKPGNVEFAFGFKRAVAEHLTGSPVLRGDFWIGVTMRKDKGRFYGLESKNMAALEALCSKGFEVCHIAKLQNWVYRSSTVQFEDIGEGASVGGCLIQSAKLPFFNDDADNTFRYDWENVHFGPGFIEFLIPPDLRGTHHGGRQNKFEPYNRLSHAAEVLNAAGIPFEQGVSLSTQKPAIVVEGE